MTGSDFFSSQTFGVIIGAVLTAGFTWFVEFLKDKREEKLYLKRKREETYLKILSIYYIHNQEQNSPFNQLISTLPQMIEKIYPAINMYGSKNIKKTYNYVMHSKENKEELLIKAIRKELGIKD